MRSFSITWKKRTLCNLLLALIVIVGILADQLSKSLAIRYLLPIDTKPLWQGVLHLTYVENRGAAFGMLASNRWVFMIVSTVAILGLLVWFFFFIKKPTYLGTSAIALIVSGGIGNMIDRVAVGYVVDFVDFRLINFAVFNVADIFVCIGAGLLVLAILLEPDSKKDADGGAA